MNKEFLENQFNFIKETIRDGKYDNAFNSLINLIEEFMLLITDVIEVNKLNSFLNEFIDAFKSNSTSDMMEIIDDKIIPLAEKIYNIDITKQMFNQYMDYPFPDKWRGQIPNKIKEHVKENRGDIDIGAFYNIEYLQHLFYEKMKNYSDLRVLNAGCGTGEDAIICALMYPEVNFTALELSKNSLAKAESYAKKLNVENIQFINGNILDIEFNNKFDIIISSGVIHHLADPLAGLINLKRFLKDDGFMSIMVYGEYGRFELSLMQKSIKLLMNEHKDFAEEIELTKNLYNNIERKSRIAELDIVSEVEDYDNHIVDMVLNRVEKTYTINTLNELIKSADMKITNFLTPYTYEPENYVNNTLVNEKLKKMNFIDKAYLAELMNGRIMRHCIICTHSSIEVKKLNLNDGVVNKYVAYKSPYLCISKKNKSDYDIYIDTKKTLENCYNMKVATVYGVYYGILKEIDGKQNIEQIYLKFKNLISKEGFIRYLNDLIENKFVYVHSL